MLLLHQDTVHYVGKGIHHNFMYTRLRIPLTLAGTATAVDMQIMETYGRVKVYVHLFLALVLDWGDWPGMCISTFTSEKRALSTHWIGGWVGSRVDLKILGKKKHILYLVGIQ